MIDFTKPIVDFRSDADKARDQQKLVDHLVQQGRIAHRLGLKNEPPPYVIEDWQSHWRDGWRWQDEDEDEEEKERERRK